MGRCGRTLRKQTKGHEADQTDFVLPVGWRDLEAREDNDVVREMEEVQFFGFFVFVFSLMAKWSC